MDIQDGLEDVDLQSKTPTKRRKGASSHNALGSKKKGHHRSCAGGFAPLCYPEQWRLYTRQVF